VADPVIKAGRLFVKFHTSHRADFERRIYGRIEGYHREDPSMKEAIHQARQLMHTSKKKWKRNKYLSEREIRQRTIKEVERRNKRRAWWRRVVRFFRSL
jgi:hypothetical protein